MRFRARRSEEGAEKGCRTERGPASCPRQSGELTCLALTRSLRAGKGVGFLAGPSSPSLEEAPRSNLQAAAPKDVKHDKCPPALPWRFPFCPQRSMRTPSHLPFQGIFGDISLRTQAFAPAPGKNPVSQTSVNTNATFKHSEPLPQIPVRTATSPSQGPLVQPL